MVLAESLAEKQDSLLSKPGIFARFLVLKVIGALWEGKDVELTHIKGFNNLSQEDRDFVRKLYMTFLKHVGEIDAVIYSFPIKRIDKKNNVILDILRLGIAQLYYLKTPPHAVIATTLDIIDLVNRPFFKPLVHSLLSKISQGASIHLLKQNNYKLNVPEWIVERWRNFFGLGKTQQIIASLIHEAPIDITVKKDSKVWAETLGGTLLPFGSIRLPLGSKIEGLEGYKEGAWWVQDWSASLAVKLLNPSPNTKVLDLCAAPGGKTAQLASMGAKVTAIDISSLRLKRLKENLKRLNLEVNVIEADAREWSEDVFFDYILVDAPCSATGTFRRHPERKFLRSLKDIGELVQIQQLILKTAIKHLTPGGILIYCTCSLEKEENEAQIDNLIAQNPEMELFPFQEKDVEGNKSLLTPLGDVQIFPFVLNDQGGVDGFFVSRLRKKIR